MARSRKAALSHYHGKALRHAMLPAVAVAGVTAHASSKEPQRAVRNTPRRGLQSMPLRPSHLFTRQFGGSTAYWFQQASLIEGAAGRRGSRTELPLR